MIMKVDVYTAKEMMVKWDRDYFSIDGLKAILNFYPEDANFNPVDICCDWTEYGENCAVNFDDLVTDYGYKVDYTAENPETLTNADRLEILKNTAFLDDFTKVIHLRNGNILLKPF